MTEQGINNRLQEAIKAVEIRMLHNMVHNVYGDNALRDALYKPVKQTFWRRTKNKLRTAKDRISNAWAALKGDLDYDY